MNTLTTTKQTRRGIAQRGVSKGVCANYRGGATSAAKLNGRHGVHERETYTWVSGEGWVKWVEIERSVARAFQAWQVRQQRRQMHLMPV